MFILSENKSSAFKATKAYKNKLVELHNDFSDIYEIQLNHRNTLHWFSAKPQDQLHVYDNAVVIGKLVFDESQSKKPIYHKGENLNSFNELSINTLIHTSVIYYDDNHIEVIPNEVVNLYYSDKSISDFQTLIAKAESLLPSQIAIQTLAAVGYFPGNMTLFNEIKKIPYLHKLNNQKLEKIEDFKPQKHNDSSLIKRLTEIVPQNVKNDLAMSGGLDSRFVLGVLLKSGVKPDLISLDGKEKSIVVEVAKTYDLDLTVNKEKHIRHDLYTLMTDSRIYFRGGNYSKMISNYSDEGVIHYGLSLVPYNENSFASAWKRPTFKTNLYDDLINYALLPRVPSLGFKQFKTPISKEDLFKFLKDEMKFGLEYMSLNSKKETASWFYHLARGLTWTYAHLSDLSFFKYPVFLLGDKNASELGFKSSAYSNFNKERLRRMNQSLFKDSIIDYSDSRKFNSSPIIISDVSKIYNEFFKKLYSRFKGLKPKITNDNENWFDEIDLTESKNFKLFFNEDFDNTIKSKNSNLRIKRTAVTLNDLLMFLES